MIDTFLGHWSPSGSAAINFFYNDNGDWDVDLVQWDYSLCSEQMLVDGECLPFLQTSGIVLTAGYALTLVFFFPMALMDLKVRDCFIFVVVFIYMCAFTKHFVQGKCYHANYWIPGAFGGFCHLCHSFLDGRSTFGQSNVVG